ncbi:J domain-containing protein [Spiroplasma endosymbiont of Panorpa germanica]|uniref:J domain-containing protein n=1 Tax=Spiroplasma endosymbiont of Panorpa germanica TaxID=3066314 RepID=UPI0030D44ECB
MKSKKVAEPVDIFYFNSQEKFDKYPFQTKLYLTEKFLFEKTGDRAKGAEILEQIYDSFEKLFLDWSTQESRLLSKFDEIQMNSPIKIKYITYIKYYNNYLDRTREVFLEQFCNKIMPSFIGKGLGLNASDIFPAGNFEQIIADSSKIIMDYNKRRCDEVINNATNDINKMIENLFQNINSFFSGAHNQGFNQGQRTNQNNQRQGYNQGFANNQTNELAQAYKMMGVSEKIGDKDLKRTYLKLAKEYHPDVNDSVYAKEKMAKINAAYDTIRKARGI